MNSQNLLWTQMSRLPDDILDDDDIKDVTWNELHKRWNPEKKIFVPSLNWTAGLVAIGAPADEVHMGLISGALKPPFNEFNISLLQECTKAGTLLVQIVSGLKDRQMKVADMTGEVFCSVHFKVVNNFNLAEGLVLLLSEVTVLPGLVLNLTSKNIVKIFGNNETAEGLSKFM